MNQDLNSGTHVAAGEAIAGNQSAHGTHGRLLDSFGQANRQLSQLLENWQQQARNLAAVNHIARTVVSALDLGEILSAATTEIQDTLHVEAARIVLSEPETGALVVHACTSCDIQASSPRCVLRDQDIATQVVRSGQAARINDLSHEPHFYPDVDLVTSFQVHSILCVPLLVSGRAIGAIEVVNRLGDITPGELGRFTRYDQELLQGVAAFVAMAADNARLQAAMREQVALKTLQQTVVTLAHHVNNPLQGLVGAADLLKGRLGVATHEGKLPDAVSSTPDELLDVILDKAQEITSVLLLLQEVSLPHSTVYLGGQRMLDIQLELQNRLAGVSQEPP